MSHHLTEQEVNKVADLCLLELSEAESQQMAGHLSKILDYIDMLEQVDTENVEPLAHPIEITDVFRDDTVTPSLAKSEALKNAPETDGDYFVVPAILSASENDS